MKCDDDKLSSFYKPCSDVSFYCKVADKDVSIGDVKTGFPLLMNENIKKFISKYVEKDKGMSPKTLVKAMKENGLV